MFKNKAVEISFYEAHHSPRASRDMPRENENRYGVLFDRFQDRSGKRCRVTSCYIAHWHPAEKILAGIRANKKPQGFEIKLSLVRQGVKLMSNEPS